MMSSHGEVKTGKWCNMTKLDLTPKSGSCFQNTKLAIIHIVEHKTFASKRLSLDGDRLLLQKFHPFHQPPWVIIIPGTHLF